jgi:hypothetical protein
VNLTSKQQHHHLHHHHSFIPPAINSVIPSGPRIMDTLIARYASPHDDCFDDEDDTAQLTTTKPSHDHQFSLPPIAQVHSSGSSLSFP